MLKCYTGIRSYKIIEGVKLTPTPIIRGRWWPDVEGDARKLGSAIVEAKRQAENSRRCGIYENRNED